MKRKHEIEVERSDVMAKTSDGHTKSERFRKRAEQLMCSTKSEVRDMSARAVEQVVYELQIHRIELEMQNEELRRAQTKLEEARDRYHDLYDFSPIGHLTRDAQGRIVEANLQACTLLNVNRIHIMHQ